MRKYSLGVIAFAMTLVVTPPSALCDSSGQGTSDSKPMISSFDSSHGGAPNGIAESATITNTDLADAGGPNTVGALRNKTVERPRTGAFFFDNLLQGNKGGHQNNSGSLTDLNGQQLVLLSGSEKAGPRFGKSGQFYFADKGTYKVSNEFQKSGGLIKINATAETVTPGPRSLFLLGTGLLGFALVLFWEAARRSTRT